MEHTGDRRRKPTPRQHYNAVSSVISRTFARGVRVGPKIEEIAFELSTLYPTGGLAHYIPVKLPTFVLSVATLYALVRISPLCAVSIFIILASHPYQHSLTERFSDSNIMSSAANQSGSDQKYGRITNVISWLLLCVMILTVGTRAATKWTMIRRLEGDDILALIAFVSLLQVGENRHCTNPTL